MNDKLDIFFKDGPYPYFDCPPLTNDLVASAEQTLGFKLPDSYLSVLRIQNGGVIVPHRFIRKEDSGIQRDFWIPLLYGVGGSDGIDSQYEGLPRSKFLIDQWDYPDTGIVICHVWHTAFMLDYSVCYSAEEPRVVYVNRERPSDKEEPVAVSNNFADFIDDLIVKTYP